MRTIPAVIVFSALCGVVWAQAPDQGGPLKGFDTFKSPEDAATASVRRVLTDPYSAKFGRTTIYLDKHGQEFACGSVNAKNGNGAYTGKSPFYVSLFNIGKNDKPAYFGFATVAGATGEEFLKFVKTHPTCKAALL